MTFQKGQSGNPKGRPSGHRDRVTEAFLRDLEAFWQRTGEVAFDKAMAESPATFVKMVASLLPKDVQVTHNYAERFLEIIKALNVKSGEVGTSLDSEPGQSAEVRH